MHQVNLAVIDDDEMYVLALKKLLEKVKFSDRTVYFENGNIALNYFDKWINQPDLIPELILLDVNMPVTNGWQFIKEFRKLKTRINKKITIYMISNTVNQDEINRARELEEVSDFVCKPVTFITLTQILSRMN